MTRIFALKDMNSGKFLTKHKTFQELTTTTRTFQHINTAAKALVDPSTLWWAAVTKRAGEIRGRVAIDSEEFRQYEREYRDTINLQIRHINIEEIIY